MRDALRVGLDPVAATVVDQVSSLDAQWDSQTAEALVATATLAPETFVPAIVEYLFALLEGPHAWAADIALRILVQLGADPARLARCALKVLSQDLAGETAARAMMATLDHVPPDAVEAALPQLIELADPLDLPFPVGEDRHRPEGLLALHRRHSSAVERSLESLLVQTAFEPLSLGARGAMVIANHDAAAARRLARATVSALTRSKVLDETYGATGQAVNALREAVAQAYRVDPQGVEDLMQNFRVGAYPKGQGRLFTVYREILDRSFDGAPIEPTESQKAAFRRVLRAVTETQPNEVEHEIYSVFQGSPRDLIQLAKQHVDELLGAALVLDDRLNALDAEVKSPSPDVLAGLEHMNRRGSLHELQKNLVNWSAEGAAGDVAATRQYLLLLDNLPEDRERLRAVLVGRLKKLAVSPDTFALVLPPLYGAMVGASTLVRAAAVKVVGALPLRLVDDAPGLLIEALVALLYDPYQLVVTNTVDALKRLTLPEPYRAQVRNRLVELIGAYAEARNQTEFLLSCVELLVHDHLTDAEKTGRAGGYIIDVLARHPSRDLARSLPSLGRVLGEVRAFGRLVLGAVQDPQTMQLRGEDVVRALRDLSPDAVAEIREGLVAVGQAAPAIDVDVRLGPRLIEVFSAVGDWAAAQAIADAAVDKVGDTRREQTRKLAVKLVQAATAFERAVAEGRPEEADRLGQDWLALRAKLQAA